MIPLFKVHMPETVITNCQDVLTSGYIAEGPCAAAFEKKFSDYIGNPNTVMLNSCTSAITLALRLAGVGPGDEVITSAMTCLATNEPILTSGADIVWADINSETGNIDPKDVEAKITKRTKAILFVDWSGIPADLDALGEISRRENVVLIEDAAHATGAKYKGKMIGSVDSPVDFTCFSFQAIKHLTTGDGGALACKTPEIAERARKLRWFGMERKNTARDPVNWSGDVTEPGYKMHMNDISGTIGLAQMPYLQNNVDSHIKNAKKLQITCSETEGISSLKVAENTNPSYWIFTVLLPNEDSRRNFSESLIEAGVANSIVHTRNDNYSLFKKYKTDLPKLDSFSSRMLNLPCGWWLTSKEMEHICKSVKAAMSNGL